jgi:mono/diheme cytochrome c family protein
LALAQTPVERGKYLVEEVAKCQACHTPKTAEGALDKTKWLKGATLDFAPMHEVEGWHKTAPDLTGPSNLFKRWQAQGLVNFLMTTKNPRGNKADPPMPDYHLSKDDAEAIVAYLQSLP